MGRKKDSKGNRPRRAKKRRARQRADAIDRAAVAARILKKRVQYGRRIKKTVGAGYKGGGAKVTKF